MDKRHTELEESVFKPIPDEVLSKQRVDLLLGLGIAVPILGCVLQAGIAYVFFRFGHPWKRILQSELFSVETKSKSQNDNKTDENNAEEDYRDAGNGEDANEEQSDVEVANSTINESQQLGSEYGVEDQHIKYGTNEDMELATPHSNVNSEVESVGSGKEQKLTRENNCEFQESRL